MNKEESIEMRKVMGTLPSESPEKSTKIRFLKESIEVTLENAMENPYKVMVCTSTSTWGKNDFQQKWPLLSNSAKLEIIKAVLTNNTLPQAREMCQFIFRVTGIPRWLFDYHTQIPFTSFMSIGCRDNNKKDSDVILNEQIQEEDKHVFLKLKDLYEETLTDNKASWQTARAFLPQSYLHSYHLGQNLLSIANTRLDKVQYKEEMQILYKEIVSAVGAKFPLIGIYLNTLFENKKDVFDFISKLQFEDLKTNDQQLISSL